jgi:UDP-3-O-[3-hydroxymyristoyl] N-acetylglucosamine deacetylase / 3-hydroxyacyl-[acyl-carrier-protein] dehydratase
MLKQKTISKEAVLKGKGLHTGHDVNVVFKPAAAHEGIRFVRTDLADRPVMELGDMDVIGGGDAGRYSALKNKGAFIYTVEHLVSALAGLGIDNITIEIDGDEVPGFDGSAQAYVQALKSAGVVELPADKEYFQIKEPICVAKDGASVMIMPAEDFRISYALEYPHPMLRQTVTFVLTPGTYEKELSSCRTFCLKEEADALLARGLGQGASTANTLVFGAQGVLDNTLRFPDEAARHKVLDCLGDLYLLGLPIKGHVFAFKSGHNLNRELLKKIAQQKKKYEAAHAPFKVEYMPGSSLDVRGIMSIIPHRYPFLLVDRILELESGKRAVAIKNVTANEAFFQGHFPGKPVMPGVLMLEAMAQVTAVTLLSTPALLGKIGFYMSIDAVKFRKVVEPGDQLVMEIEVVKARSRIAQAKGVCKVDGQIVCEAEMGFAFGDQT